MRVVTLLKGRGMLTHHVTVCVVILMSNWLCVFPVMQPAVDKPIDERAAKICLHLASLANMPLSQRFITAEDEKDIIKLLELDNSDVKICALVALAFARSDDGYQILTRYAKDTDKSICGIASAALKIRENCGRPHDEQLTNLFFWLGRSDNPYEKMLVVNRIVVDFGEKAIGTIVTAGDAESDNMVRCDMLYYISRSNDLELLRRSLKWQLDEKLSVSNSISFLLGSLTPNRPKDSIGNSCAILFKKIRSRIEK